jgi:hypothetical protein
MSGARWRTVLALVLLGSVALACAGDGNSNGDGSDAETIAPLFPASYLDTYTEVRDCRESGDHDLNMVRILASKKALTPYQERMDPFPVGAVVLKEEYEFGDPCEGPIKQWTVMKKLEDGSSKDTLDWSWQRVDADRKVVDSNPSRCISCHQGCGIPPDGYEGTCAMP